MTFLWYINNLKTDYNLCDQDHFLTSNDPSLSVSHKTPFIWVICTGEKINSATSGVLLGQNIPSHIHTYKLHILNSEKVFFRVFIVIGGLRLFKQLAVGYLIKWFISSWEENNCCQKLANWKKGQLKMTIFDRFGVKIIVILWIC